jgi:hypothetical protein
LLKYSPRKVSTLSRRTHHLISCWPALRVTSPHPVVGQGEEAVSVGSEGGLPLVGGLVTFLVLPVLGVLRRRGGPADIIIGTAGRQGVCAAQGLPDVASVDATPRQAV